MEEQKRTSTDQNVGEGRRRLRAYLQQLEEGGNEEAEEAEEEEETEEEEEGRPSAGGPHRCGARRGQSAAA